MKPQSDMLKWLMLAARGMYKTVYQADCVAADIVSGKQINWVLLDKLYTQYKALPYQSPEAAKLPEEVTEALRLLDHLYYEAYNGLAHELSKAAYARALLLLRHQVVDLTQMRHLLAYWKKVAEDCSIAYYEVVRESALNPQTAAALVA